MKKYIVTIISIFWMSYSVMAQEISVDQVLTTAHSYVNHQWTARSQNIWPFQYCNGTPMETPDWVRVGTNTAVPYCSSGNYTISQFDQAMAAGKSAGDWKCEGYRADPDCTSGVDCSGFVSRCYGLSTHYTTGMIASTPSLFGFHPSMSHLRPGDMVNKSYSHVRLIQRINPNGTIDMIESSAGEWRVHYDSYSVSNLSGYRPQYYKRMTTTAVEPCDIVIQQLWTDAGEPRVGDETVLVAELRNISPTAAEPINMNFRIDGNIVGTASFPQLTQAEPLFLTANHIFNSPGIHRYCVYVNGANNETNTANNSYCINVNVQPAIRKDLVVSRVWVEPNTFEEQEDVTLFAEIKNTGNVNSDNVTLRFNVDNSEVGTVNSGTLSPNQSVVKQLANYQFQYAGNHSVCAKADEMSGEADNFNNRLCTSVNALPATHPDLIVEDVWTVLEEPEVDEAVQLFVKLKNVGDRAAATVNFDYKIDNNTVGSGTLSSLGINESVVKSFDNHRFNAAGEFEYCVNVNPVEREENTYNNSGCEYMRVFPREDISLSEMEIDPTGVIMAGTDIDVSAAQKYVGRRYESQLEDFKLSYYLSRDCTLSSDDILLGEDVSSLGRDHEEITEVERVNVYNTLVPGTYYILFVADSENVLEEYDEANNIECMEVELDNEFINGDDLSTRVYIYPNPTKDILHLLTNTDVNIKKIEVYDSSGRLVRNIEGNLISGIDLSTLMQGGYHLKMYDANEDTAVFRVIKE